MDSRCRVSRSTTFLYLVLLTTGAGCSEAVMLSQETEHGGVMTYSYKEDRGGAMGSEYRKPALDAIQAKCMKGSRILREGEVKGHASAGMGIVEGTEDDTRGRRWGIQFECKTAGNVSSDERDRERMGASKG